MRKREERAEKESRWGGKGMVKGWREREGRGETIETSQERTIFCPSTTLPRRRPFAVLALGNQPKTPAGSSTAFVSTGKRLRN